MFDRKYFFGLLIVDIICTGCLSFFIFYHIGSYVSTDSDVSLKTDIYYVGTDVYSVDIGARWNNIPEIFGFDGNDDMIIIRYDPEKLELLCASQQYKENIQGKCLIQLSQDYAYAKIGKNEKEIGFRIKDGNDDVVSLNIKRLESGGPLKAFFIHDYKIPLDSPTYWEKTELLELK